MRARFAAYEPAGAGFVLARVRQQRDRLSRSGRRSRALLLVSACVHAGAIVALLLMKPGSPPGEEQTAPSFAIQFDTGAPQTATPLPSSEPRVSLGGSDAPPPPEQTQEAEQVEPPLPRLHYGTARHPRANNNPFANIVPFDLSPNQPHNRSSGMPTSRGLDLAAGPVVREGKITDSITHAPGSQVSGDYDAIIQAFVEAHREQIQESLQDAQAGQAVLQVTIARDGRVLRLHLLKPSGSALLDAAWVSFFRDYRLPPLSSDISGDEYTFAYELDYSIIYGQAAR